MIAGPANDIADYGHLLVRRAIHREDWVADEIFDRAAEGRTEWTPSEWAALLKELGQCDQTISDWLVLYS